MKIKIPDDFNPWIAMENHRNPELLELLLKRKKKARKKNDSEE